MVDGVELVLLPAPGAAAFYGVEDPDDQAWMDARLTGHPWRCFEQPLELTDETALAGDPAVPHHLRVDARARSPNLIADSRARPADSGTSTPGTT